MLPNVLSSEVLSCLEICEANRILTYSRYQVSFYLCQMGPVLRNSKVTKYYDQDCLKIFFFHSTLRVIFQIYGKTTHLLQNSSIKKLPINRVERSLKSIFEVNQISKIVLTQSH